MYLLGYPTTLSLFLAAPNLQDRINRFLKLMPELPVCNRTLVAWIMVHMLHVLQNVSKAKLVLVENMQTKDSILSNPVRRIILLQ